MSKNLELKARISSVSDAVCIVHQLNAKEKGILRQRDIYYNVPRGRLKLRIINNRNAELIFYNRPNKNGSRYSDYFLLSVSNAKLTDELCTSAFGQKVVVKKKRRLFLYKNSRIHIDKVSGLGTFIEFEVLVNRGKQQAQKLLRILTMKFGIKRTDTIAVSYSDMMINSKE